MSEKIVGRFKLLWNLNSTSLVIITEITLFFVEGFTLLAQIIVALSKGAHCAKFIFRKHVCTDYWKFLFEIVRYAVEFKCR